MIVAFETLVKHHPKIRQKGDFIGLFDKKITAAKKAAVTGNAADQQNRPRPGRIWQGRGTMLW